MTQEQLLEQQPQSIALMPNDAVSSVMDEFLFEFDDDVEDDGSNETGLRVTGRYQD